MKHRKFLLLAGLTICNLCTVTHADDLHYYRQVEYFQNVYCQTVIGHTFIFGTRQGQRVFWQSHPLYEPRAANSWDRK